MTPLLVLLQSLPEQAGARESVARLLVPQRRPVEPYDEHDLPPAA